jgi:hypothetical protein
VARQLRARRDFNSIAAQTNRRRAWSTHNGPGELFARDRPLIAKFEQKRSRAPAQ